jgi:hypothetical protein
MSEGNEILEQIKALGDELRARLDGLDERLYRIEAELAGAPAPAKLPTPTISPAPAIGRLDPSAPVRSVDVTITPLRDVSKVRVVEAAFDAIDGVESTSLQTLSGDEAHLEVRAHDDVALISGLRRTLQLAFDVTQSDGSSFTIALAQPGAEREGGVAAHRLS